MKKMVLLIYNRCSCDCVKSPFGEVAVISLAIKVWPQHQYCRTVFVDLGALLGTTTHSERVYLSRQNVGI